MESLKQTSAVHIFESRHVFRGCSLCVEVLDDIWVRELFVEGDFVVETVQGGEGGYFGDAECDFGRVEGVGGWGGCGSVDSGGGTGG